MLNQHYYYPDNFYDLTPTVEMTPTPAPGFNFFASVSLPLLIASQSVKVYRELASVAARLRGIFCDVDDTLTHDGVLVPAAYDAIARATRGGAAGRRRHRPAGRLGRGVRVHVAARRRRRRKRRLRGAPRRRGRPAHDLG